MSVREVINLVDAAARRTRGAVREWLELVRELLWLYQHSWDAQDLDRAHRCAEAAFVHATWGSGTRERAREIVNEIRALMRAKAGAA